ncbi:MAG TPA: hypothetical protein VGI78_10935, partial [Acetobacteraceae bacterium]
ILKGSPTARRLAGQEETGADFVSPILMAAHGHPLGAAANVAQQSYNALAQSRGGPAMEALGRRLFTPGAMDPAYLATLARRQSPATGPLVRNLLTMGAARRETAKP